MLVTRSVFLKMVQSVEWLCEPNVCYAYSISTAITIF